ncbi:MAG TPA: hypothetical protein VM055_07290 [Novosphingobium sp.]|nr:hypothetical protein [Novosphingobium sp.]
MLASIVALVGAAAPAAAQTAADWEIGPVIHGRNYSAGMPPAPSPAARGGWSFEFSRSPASHVHYVTYASGPLAGASRIVVRYRVDAARGVGFIAQERPDEPATVSLVFQRAGDSWSGRRHEFHRWYAPATTVQPLAPGVHELAVSLADPGWISVFGKSVATQPEAYALALERTARVGLVFGSPSARGHGVYATGPARFTLLGFRVE